MAVGEYMYAIVSKKGDREYEDCAKARSTPQSWREMGSEVRGYACKNMRRHNGRNSGGGACVAIVTTFWNAPFWARSAGVARHPARR